MFKKMTGNLMTKTLAAFMLLALALTLLPVPPAYAVACTSTGGNWNTPATWDCGHVPGSAGNTTDTVTITSGTVTLDTSPTIAGLTVNGTLTFNATAIRSLTVNGNVVINSGGIFITQASTTRTHTVTISGDLTNNGTFDMSRGGTTLVADVTFIGASDQTVISAGTLTRFRGITLNKADVNNRVIVSGPVNISGVTDAITYIAGTWEQTSGTLTFLQTNTQTLNSANGKLVASGSGSITFGGSAVFSNGIFQVNTSGIVTVGGTGNRLEISGGTVQLMAGTVNVGGRIGSNNGSGLLTNGTLEISGATVNVPYTLLSNNANGVFMIGTGGTFQMSSGTLNILQANQGTFTGNDIEIQTGTVSGGTIVVGSGSPGNMDFLTKIDVIANNINVNTGSRKATLVSNLAAAGDVVISGGTLDAGTNNRNVSIGGNWSNSGTFTPGTGTATFNGTSAQTLGGSAVTNFNNLTISNTSADVSASTNFNVAGTMNLNGAATVLNPGAGVVINSAASAGTLTGSGTVKVTKTGGTDDFAEQYKFSTYTLSALTVNYNGGAGQVTPARTFFNLKIDNPSGVALSGNVTTNGALTLANGALGVGVNSLTLNGMVTCGSNTINSAAAGTVSYAQTSDGQAVCAGTYGNLTFNNNNKTLSPSGTIGVAGTFTPGSATGHIVTGSTVDFNGAGAQTVPGFTFNNLTINNSGNVTLGADTTVNGSLTFTNGRIATGTSILTIGSGGSVTGAGSGKYVYGNLQKIFASGASQTFKFEIGDATNYAPAEVSSLDVATGGSLTASTVNDRQPEFFLSGIGDQYIKRYWTVTPGSSGLTLSDKYDITLSYVAGDVVGTPNEDALIVQKFDYGTDTWSDPDSHSSSAATRTVTGTGFSGFSDFYAGEGGVPALPVTLSYFTSMRIGTEVLFDWSTATESGNVGFNLYGVDSAGKRVLLNEELIPSQSSDALARQDYSLQLDTPFDTFYIEDVNIRGTSDLHGPYQIGETYGSRVEENRIDWVSIQAEHQSVRKELSLELLGRPEMLSLNLKVRRNGLYRMTYEMLRDAGLDLGGLPAENLLLTNRGKQVPMYVAGADPFGPGGYIEFYGQALDTLYTDANVYVLQVSPTRVGSLLVEDTIFNRGLAEGTGTYTETLEINNQRAYADYAPGSDAWYDTSMLVYTSSKSWETPFQVDGLANPGETTDLELVVWGVTDWPQNPDHHLLVSVNGLQVATDTFDGLVEQTLRIKLPAGLLHEGENTLKLTLPGDSGADWDMINLDSFSVTYSRLLQAREGHLAFTAAGKSFTVTNLPGADVVVYRLNAKGAMTRLDLVRVRPAGDGTFNATFSGAPQPAKYFVSSVDAMLTPEADLPRAKADLGRPARYLIIAHPDFIAGLQPLIQAREAQGLTVSVVDVTDLYDRYTYGIFDAQAIKQYVAYAVRNLGTEYVLLVGGDTYDYRNYLGIDSISYIPSLYATTGATVNFVPVDPLYADVNDDNVPDVALGRFPVRSVAELNLMVSKTLAYAAKDYGQTAVFASDLDDGGLSFKDINNDMAALLPSSWTVENIHLNDLNVTMARSRLIAAMNRGTALVTFTGHSGPQEWTFSNLFDMSNAAALTNHGRPFVVAQWGCWNSYYVDPVYNYMVQSFLFSGDQGAAAVLGASTMTESTSEVLLGKLLTPRLAVPGKPVGQALLEAKIELAQTYPDLLDVLLGWTLMGDPALVVVP